MAEFVKKRNGKTERFSRLKLLHSMHNSMHHARITNLRLEEKITEDVTISLKKKTVTSEGIRKAVCAALKKNKRHEVCDYYSLVWLHAKPVRVKSVVKHSGRKERFSPEKLFKSVQKSFKHARVRDGMKLELAMHDILKAINSRYKNREIHVDEIKYIVEFVLVKRKLDSVAKHYILYRYS